MGQKLTFEQFVIENQFNPAFSNEIILEWSGLRVVRKYISILKKMRDASTSRVRRKHL